MSYVLSVARRFLLNFNAISLILLAFQNAGYLVLMGYAQQLQEIPTSPAEPPRSRFVSSHFLATTEFTKLLISIAWCMYEVLKDMQKDATDVVVEAGGVSTIAVEANDAGDTDPYSNEKASHRLHDSEARSLVLAAGSPTVSCSVAASLVTPTASDAAAKKASHEWPATEEKRGTEEEDMTERGPAARKADRPFTSPAASLLAVVTRKRFLYTFRSRMRHAVGLDGKYKEALLMVVPAVLYTIQGLLLILALKYLDPTLFQILYQVRIFFLAIMMRMVLGFQLSPIRWMAVVALMVGIVLAQLSTQRGSGGKESVAHKDAVRSSWSIEGTLAALAGAFLSSFSGVFMEFVFKKRGNLFTLSARNIHLAFFSLLYFVFVFAHDAFYEEKNPNKAVGLRGFFASFFDGFTGLVWFLVVLQAVGGILVALVVRYCDNIVKSFSTAFAIVLSGTASVFLFHMPLEPLFLLGSSLVMTSITVYSLKK